MDWTAWSSDPILGSWVPLLGVMLGATVFMTWQRRGVGARVERLFLDHAQVVEATIRLDRSGGLALAEAEGGSGDGSAASEAVQQKKLLALMQELGVSDEDLVDVSYEGLLDEDVGAR